MTAASTRRRLQHLVSLVEFVRQFLTPQVWKQARQAVPPRRRKPRWDLQPLVLVLLAMTWTAGDSELERFEAARGFYVMSYEGRNVPCRREHWSWRMRPIWAMNLPPPFSVTIDRTCCDCRRRTESTRSTTPLSKNGMTDKS